MEFRGILAISKPKEFLRFFNGSRLKLGDISESVVSILFALLKISCSYSSSWCMMVLSFVETSMKQIMNKYFKTNNNSNQFIYTGK